MSGRQRSRGAAVLACQAAGLSLGLMVLTAGAACSRQMPTAAEATAPDPLAEDAQNVRLVGHHDLQGRTALVVTTKSDPANGNWVYVGHVPNTRTKDATINPITRHAMRSAVTRSLRSNEARTAVITGIIK